jgi:hypothetical protein
VWELRAICEELGLQAISSPDALHGLMRAVYDKPDLILLDPATARLGRFEMAAVAARHARIASIPVIAHLSGAEPGSTGRYYRRMGVEVVRKGMRGDLRDAMRRALRSEPKAAFANTEEMSLAIA